jgi:hypothetical protein
MHELQHIEADVVCLFRVKREQQWFYQRIQH